MFIKWYHKRFNLCDIIVMKFWPIRRNVWYAFKYQQQKTDVLRTLICSDHVEVLSHVIFGEILNFHYKTQFRYSRSDCSGVRTRTVTLVESDWPMVSVTVSWNLYIPDVRLDTIIWSLKVVFYRTKRDKHFLLSANMTLCIYINANRFSIKWHK